MSPANLARVAQQHQIPIRPRGGASHAAGLNASDVRLRRR